MQGLGATRCTATRNTAAAAGAVRRLQVPDGEGRCGVGQQLPAGDDALVRYVIMTRGV